MYRVPRPRETKLPRFVLLLIILLLDTALQGASPGAFAQSKASSQNLTLPEFEVASVRHTPTSSRIINALLTYPGGRVEAKGATLEYLLMEAFDVQPFQITGAPAWAKETQFDIEAKPPDSLAAKYKTSSGPKTPPSEKQRKMLQNLLIERFQLQTHIAHGTGPVFF
jgi:uncharacterized protein (TIGR03435 family)